MRKVRQHESFLNALSLKADETLTTVQVVFVKAHKQNRVVSGRRGGNSKEQRYVDVIEDTSSENRLSSDDF